MPNDLTTRIMQYEGGDMSEEDVLALFQELVNTGLAWKLQGHYGRTATSLLQQGLIFDADTQAVAYHAKPTRGYRAGPVLDRDWDDDAAQAN